MAEDIETLKKRVEALRKAKMEQVERDKLHAEIKSLEREQYLERTGLGRVLKGLSKVGEQIAKVGERASQVDVNAAISGKKPREEKK